jgi:hypothetical protein
VSGGPRSDIHIPASTLGANVHGPRLAASLLHPGPGTGFAAGSSRPGIRGPEPGSQQPAVRGPQPGATVRGLAGQGSQTGAGRPGRTAGWRTPTFEVRSQMAAAHPAWLTTIARCTRLAAQGLAALAIHAGSPRDTHPPPEPAVSTRSSAPRWPSSPARDGGTSKHATPAISPSTAFHPLAHPRRTPPNIRPRALAPPAQSWGHATSGAATCGQARTAVRDPNHPKPVIHDPRASRSRSTGSPITTLGGLPRRRSVIAHPATAATVQLPSPSHSDRPGARPSPTDPRDPPASPPDAGRPPAFATARHTAPSPRALQHVAPSPMAVPAGTPSRDEEQLGRPMPGGALGPSTQKPTRHALARQRHRRRRGRRERDHALPGGRGRG